MQCQQAHLDRRQLSLSVGGVGLCTGVLLLVRAGLAWPQTQQASAHSHAGRTQSGLGPVTTMRQHWNSTESAGAIVCCPCRLTISAVLPVPLHPHQLSRRVGLHSHKNSNVASCSRIK